MHEIFIIWLFMCIQGRVEVETEGRKKSALEHALTAKYTYIHSNTHSLQKKNEKNITIPFILTHKYNSKNIHIHTVRRTFQLVLLAAQDVHYAHKIIQRSALLTVTAQL